MITAISLNAALGEPIVIEKRDGSIEEDWPIRFSNPHVACKAVNAMRTIQALEPDRHRLLISLGGGVGDQLDAILRAEGLPHEIIPAESSNRRVLVMARRFERARWKFWEWKSTRTMRGVDIDRLMAAVMGRFGESDTLVVSGTPPQIPEGLSWIPIFQALERSGARVILDSSIWKRLLDGGIRPWLLKMNRAEWGGRAKSPQALIGEMRRFREVRRMQTIVVTDGSRGAWAVDASSAWHVTSGDVCDQNPIGCGDAFTGGLAVALSQDRNLPEALRLAAACARENLETRDPGGIENPKRLKQFEHSVEVTAVD